MSVARLLHEAHGLARAWWDPARRLLLHPGGGFGARHVTAADAVGLVAATTWWAHGLLTRGAAGDRELAEVALQGVLDAVAAPNGTPLPVGVGLALVLRDHDLPPSLSTAARTAARGAVDPDVELDPTATSDQVQRAWLELEVGRWRGDEALLARGGQRAQAVAADAGVRGHVAEHSCPTRTGHTLLGLSLWAGRPPVDDLAPLGRALRDEVWHDLLAAWHPGLRTLVPPFTAARGMDLRTHVAAAGLWLAWLVDGADPLPPLWDDTLDQAQDLPLVFLVDALAAAGPDVRQLAPLVRAQPPRQGEWFDRVGERVWTGWTGGDLALGAEWSPVDRAWPAVPAAAVWRGAGGNAWLRLHQRSGPVEARVEHEPGTVRLVHGTSTGPVELWVGGPGDWEVARDTVTDGVRRWRVHGVDGVAPVTPDTPGAASGWTLASDDDGIVLTTEV